MTLEQTPYFPGSGGQITPPPRHVTAQESATERHAAPAQPAPLASIAPAAKPAAPAPIAAPAAVKPAPVAATTAAAAPKAAPVKPAAAAPDSEKAAIRAELAFNEQLLKHPKLAKGEAPKVRAKINALRAALR